MHRLEGLAHTSVPGGKVLNFVTALTYLYHRNMPAAIVFQQRHPFCFLKPSVNVNNKLLKTANDLAWYPSKGEDKDRLGSFSGCSEAEPCWVRAAGLKLSSNKKRQGHKCVLLQ